MTESLTDRDGVTRFLKRELFFWLIAAVVIVGYVALGRQLAPEIPPEPKPFLGGENQVMSIQELPARIAAFNKAKDAYEKAVRDRREFVQRWYQYGAFAGIVLVMIYTWLRPPWTIAEPSDENAAQQATGRKKSSKKNRNRRENPPAKSFFETIGLSPLAVFSMIATLAVLIGLLVAMMAWRT